MPGRASSGNVLLDYYRATGKVEYLERGVAALRAQFPVSPSENWAHEGYGGKAGVSSFHWGTGSGMAGIEIEEDGLRDAVVDVRAARGVGVNGLNVTDYRVQICHPEELRPGRRRGIRRRGCGPLGTGPTGVPRADRVDLARPVSGADSNRRREV